MSVVERSALAVAILSLVIAPPLRAEAPSQERQVAEPAGSDEQPFDSDPLPKAFDVPRMVRPSTYSGGGMSTDWAQRIDETWGPSPWSTQQMLDLYDTFWNTIHLQFACFQGLSVDWPAQRAAAHAEIESGVSLGRFVAIMNHAALALRESHTFVSYALPQTGMGRGVPLFFVGGWGNNQWFGACLTPLNDGRLLVYKTVPDHPLGLAPGDVVLGYDGVPWATLYPQLLAAQLPLTGFWWGSSPSSWTHSMLMGAGLNWHLFDTIDVVKYTTGETLHLPVDALSTTPRPPLDCTEQLPVAGVSFPDYLSTGDAVEWGVVSGTRIGYVYVQAWAGDAGTQFYEAVHTLLTQYETEGLVFDFRTNYGGSMFLAYPALELLFRDDVSTVGFAVRCGEDHQAMCPDPGAPPSNYAISGTHDPLFYDRPIAVLVGPGAVSAGDQVAHLFSFHPRARFFGESTSTAFNAPVSLSLATGWTSRYARADAYRTADPRNFLTHDESRVDEPVWLEPDDVAQGKDTVAEAAIHWIESRPIDNRPPDCAAAHAAIEVATPADRELQPVDIEGVVDPDGDPITLVATGITQDEPVHGAGGICPDAAIVNGVASIRRERDVRGDGRVYRVTFTARDSQGAESQGSVQVCVPQNLAPGGRTCVDSGQRYDATMVLPGLHCPQNRGRHPSLAVPHDSRVTGAAHPTRVLR